MLTRSQAVLVNNYISSSSDKNVKKYTSNNKVISKKPANPFTIIRTRSQTRNKLQIDTSYCDNNTQSPPRAPSGLRSSSRLPKFTVDIDFDSASNEWRKNKRSTGNGCYSYN